MHETGIAASIIEIAEGAARGAPILKVHLQLGAFTGVVREALEFAFEALKDGTLAARAELEIETIPLIAACPACDWTGAPEEDYCLICPRCGVPAVILSGREMQVDYVDLNDSQQASKGELSNGESCGRDQGPEQERGVRASQPAAL
jgi:hydrogenase nickel incorporation protein HypA/HybF